MPAPRYTSIADYLGANQGTVADERAKLAGVVGGELDAAKGAADTVAAGVAPGSDYTTSPGFLDADAKQQQAQADASGLSTLGGNADLLQRAYGDSGRQAGFDAGLITGGAPAAGVQAKAKSLTDYLGTSGAAAAQPPPPTPVSQRPTHVGPGGGPVAPPGSDPWASTPGQPQHGDWNNSDSGIPGVSQVGALPTTIYDYLSGRNENADSSLVAKDGKGFSRGGKGIHYGPDGQPINPDDEENR